MLIFSFPNFILRLIVLISLTTLVISCGGEGGDSLSGGSGSANVGESIGPNDPSNIITHRDFSVGFDNGSPEIFDKDFNFEEKEVVIIVKADDIFDLPVSGQIVNFATEWGTFIDSDSCELEGGKCSVTWIPGDPDYGPADCNVSFTAWAVGEEKFVDVNGNKLFDTGEVFVDLEEPYLDISWDYYNGECNLDGVCELIDIENFTGTTPGTGNGVHDLGDGQYNGSLCADPENNPACNVLATSTVINAQSQLFVCTDTDTDPDPDLDS